MLMKGPHYNCTQLHHVVTPRCGLHQMWSKVNPAPSIPLLPLFPLLPLSAPTLPHLVFFEWLSSMVYLLISREVDHFPITHLHWWGQESCRFPAPRAFPAHSGGSVRLGWAQLPTPATWESVQKDHELCYQTWHLNKDPWALISFTVKGGLIMMNFSKLLGGSRRWCGTKSCVNVKTPFPGVSPCTSFWKEVWLSLCPPLPKIGPRK